MDDIAKEVLRLRNQQRALIQARRDAAKEKRQRADQRRKEYEKEMNSMKSQLEEATESNSTLQKTIEGLTKELSRSRADNDSLKATIESQEKRISELKDEIVASNADVENLRNELKASKQQCKDKENEWDVQRKELEISLTRANIEQKAATDALEAALARSERERNTLPDHHLKVLNDELARVNAREGVLLQREGSLRIEEDRRRQALDILRKETLDDLTSMRKRAEEELAALRASLVAQRQDFEREKARWQIIKTEESAAIENEKISIAQRERSVAESHTQLERKKVELEVAQRMIEPMVRDAEQQKEEARSLRLQADQIMRAADEHASSVLAAERALMKREQAVAIAQQQIQLSRHKLVSDKQSLMIEAAKTTETRQKIESERFRLHQCALEMTKQAHSLKEAFGLVPYANTLAPPPFNSLSSTSTSTSTPPSLSPPPTSSPSSALIPSSSDDEGDAGHHLQARKSRHRRSPARGRTSAVEGGMRGWGSDVRALKESFSKQMHDNLGYAVVDRLTSNLTATLEGLGRLDVPLPPPPSLPPSLPPSFLLQTNSSSTSVIPADTNAPLIFSADHFLFSLGDDLDQGDELGLGSDTYNPTSSSSSSSSLPLATLTTTTTSHTNVGNMAVDNTNTIIPINSSLSTCLEDVAQATENLRGFAAKYGVLAK